MSPANRPGLIGDQIFASFSDKKCFGLNWTHFDSGVQWSIIEAVAEEEDPVRLYDWLMATHGVTPEQAKAIGRVRLPEGHGRLGETASRKILVELKKDVVTYDKAVEAALGKSHSDFRTGEILDQLPYYGEILSREIPPGSLDPKDNEEVRWGKITNPTVHIGLGQLHRYSVRMRSPMSERQQHFGQPSKWFAQHSGYSRGNRQRTVQAASDQTMLRH